jgi:hypothetical protein
MKTLKKVLKEYPQYKDLINKVIDDIGIESVKDVNSSGAGAGYGNFIYYSDTCKFWQENKSDIKELLKDTTECLGEGVIEMVRNFNCLTDTREREIVNYFSYDEVAEVIYGNGDNESIQNALAWFALEEVCRMFED